MKEIIPLEFLKINETLPIRQEFDRIANRLINEVDIAVNETFFSLYDFEFYYCSPSHKDGYAIRHTKPLGSLHMHDYGIDISLGSDDAGIYGGILIRGAWMTNSTTPKVLLSKSQFEKELFNMLKLGHNHITYSKRDSVGEYILIMTIRKSLGKIEPAICKTMDMFEAKYRYVINDSSVFAQLKGKEDILRNSTLDREKWKELLTYEVKK